MKAKLFSRTAVALCFSLSSFIAGADDIDIYLNSSSANSSDEPMAMFSIDWRPNLTATVCNGSSCDYYDQYVDLYNDGYLDKDPAVDTIEAFDLYRSVLKKVMDPLEGVKVGLMMNHDHQNNCEGPRSASEKCTNGGFIARGFESFQVGDGNGAKAEFHQILADMPLPQGNESHKYQASELFFELFRYLTGGDIYNGHNGYTSFDGSSGNSNQNIDNEHNISWDTDIENSANTSYISPLTTTLGSACGAGIFTINFMFGTLNQDSDSDAAIEADKASGGLGINVSNSNNPRFEDILSFLSTTDLADGSYGSAGNLPGEQTVSSYFLVPQPNNTENSFAEAGGTDAAIDINDASPEELYNTIKGIFDEILSISTTFVSASVPVNVYNRSEVLDNVYLALFQPLEYPSWPGNMKKLKLNTDDITNIFLDDANGDAAVAPDGRIKFDALTFWTDASELPFPDPNVTGQEADDFNTRERRSLCTSWWCGPANSWNFTQY